MHEFGLALENRMHLDHAAILELPSEFLEVDDEGLREFEAQIQLDPIEPLYSAQSISVLEGQIFLLIIPPNIFLITCTYESQ